MPIDGTSTVAMFNEKLQAGVSFLGDNIALRAMDAVSKYSVLIPARSKIPQKVRDTSRKSGIEVFGPPQCSLMDEGGEWENDAWAELRSDRRINSFLRRVGARPWILGRRNGHARGIYDRLMGDDRFSGKQILAEAQWRQNTPMSGGG